MTAELHVHDPISSALERMKRRFDERVARGEVKPPPTGGRTVKPALASNSKPSKGSKPARVGPQVQNRHPSEPPDADDRRANFAEGFSEGEARQFAAAPERAKESVLDSAAQVAALEKLLRSKLGKWFYNHDIARGLSITHVNNVASKLRDKLEEGCTGEDVDSRPITATRWVYRICLKSESFRLNRDNPSRRPGSAGRPS